METKTSPQNARALATYYHRVILLGTAIFFQIIGWTVWNGWQRQQAVELGLADQRVREASIRLKTIIKAASDQITQLESWAINFPLHTPYTGADDLRQAAKRAVASAHNGEFNLDTLSQIPADQRFGQTIGLSGASRSRPDGNPSNLDLSLSLLDRMGYGQKTSNFLRWTYFFSASKDILTITPWVLSKNILGNEPDNRTFLNHSWTYEVTTAGLPQKNPLHNSYWTKAYPDQAGAGLMVSHAVPVYWENEFVGVIATDVLLNFLTNFLKDFPDQDGLLLIANEHGQILGDRRNDVAGGSAIPSINTVLPGELLIGKPPANWQLHGEQAGRDWVFATTITKPQWTIFFILPQSAVTARVAKAYVQLSLAAILVVLTIILHYILWRMYVSPALRIADFVAHESASARPVVPLVPHQWRPWVDAMAQAFNDRRRYLEELLTTNETLELKVAKRTQELVESNARLEKLAVTDPLTGAFNRRHLFDILEAERERILRSGETMSVLMIDLDHFKKVNDSFGHAAGDAVLREFVKRSHDTVRKIDSVCRYGGEEFVVFLPGVRSESAALLAERLRSIIESAPVAFEDCSIKVTTSIGVASFRNTESVEAMLSRADQMLYKAKADGRNRVVLME